MGPLEDADRLTLDDIDGKERSRPRETGAASSVQGVRLAVRGRRA